MTDVLLDSTTAERNTGDEIELSTELGSNQAQQGCDRHGASLANVLLILKLQQGMSPLSRLTGFEG